MFEDLLRRPYFNRVYTKDITFIVYIDSNRYGITLNNESKLIVSEGRLYCKFSGGKNLTYLKVIATF